jgi:hypothetical protein
MEQGDVPPGAPLLLRPARLLYRGRGPRVGDAATTTDAGLLDHGVQLIAELPNERLLRIAPRDMGFGNGLMVTNGEAFNESGPVIGGVNPPAGAIASLNASGPVIGGVNPPAGAIASLNASGPPRCTDTVGRGRVGFVRPQ